MEIKIDNTTHTIVDCLKSVRLSLHKIQYHNIGHKPILTTKKKIIKVSFTKIDD